MAIIVMTREMGTLGKEVARAFARRKGINVVHHELTRPSHDRMAKAQESEVFRFLEGTEEEMSKWRRHSRQARPQRLPHRTRRAIHAQNQSQNR